VKRPLAILLIIIATGACYAPAVRNGFVWDDTALVLRDPLIRSWRLIPEGFNHYLFVDATASDFYRPLQRLTYTLEYAFFCARPGPYHLTNIALHIGAAIALMFFAEALLELLGCDARRRRWIATIGALIWTIHPVHTSAVVYVSGRADPLAALFGFVGCYLALQTVVRPKSHAFLPWFGAGVAFLASGLSKESGLMFPVLMVVLFAILKQPRTIIRLSIVSLFVATIYLTLRLPAVHTSPPQMGSPAPLAARPITMSRAVAQYSGLLLLPINLHMDRNIRGSFDGNQISNMSSGAALELQTLGGIIVTAVVLFWAIRARKRDPEAFVFLVAAIVSYLPISGAVGLNASIAEHWIYVPSAFFLLAATTTVSKVEIALPRPRTVIRTAAFVVTTWAVFLGVRTFIRTFDWKNQRTFLERNIAAGGDSARMLTNLAALESSENHLDLARQHLNQALKKEPDQPFAILELATVAIKQNNFTEAHRLLGKATEMPVVAGPAHELVAVLENKEKGKADLLRLRLAARSEFSNWSTEKRYIKVLAETGATASAIQELQTCLTTEWYRAESWQLLSQLLTRAGQPKAAAEAMSYAYSYDVHLADRPDAL